MPKLIKNILAMTLAFLMLVTPSFAGIVWVDGGLLGGKQVGGAYEYQEVTFVTGEPVLLRGLITVPNEPRDKDKYTMKYTYNLQGVDVTLVRNVTFDIEKQRTTVGNSGQTQTSYKRKLTQYTEVITTPDGVFTLGEYTLNENHLIDNAPALDYFSGVMNMSRTYYKNGNVLANQGKMTFDVDMRPIVGYTHIWGENVTQVAMYTLKMYDPNPNYTPTQFGSEPFTVAWEASIDVGMASTQRVSFDYVYTDPQSMSFRGNYILVTKNENVLIYKYNLPAENNKRNTGEVRLSKESILDTEALIAPRLRDIPDNYWAAQPISLLTSLKVFDVEREYFVPVADISRLEFGKAMVHAIYGVLPEPTRTDIIRRQRPGVTPPFLDVTFDDPNYHYIEFIKEKQIMAGKNYYFKGGETLTRAEAVTIMISALGLQYLAPNPPYKTSFADDAIIPTWAKDAVYVANEIGLVVGTPEGNFNPNKRVTKEEAAVMIFNLMHHMTERMSYDYREKILNR